MLAGDSLAWYRGVMVHPDEELIKTVDAEKIVREGTRIYENIKRNYEATDQGKFLAIETASGDYYLGITSAEAVEKARQDYPNTVFFVVKIGYSAAETLHRLEVASC